MNELLELIEKIKGCIPDLQNYPENDETADYAEALCITLDQKVRKLFIYGVVNWLPFEEQNFELFTELATKNKLLKKFDDGTILKEGETEPLAICTHFAEEI